MQAWMEYGEDGMMPSIGGWGRRPSALVCGPAPPSSLLQPRLLADLTNSEAKPAHHH